MKRLFLIKSLLGICLLLSAQNFEKDLAQWQKKFTETKNLSAKVEVNVYPGRNAQTPQLVRKASIERHNGNMLMKLDNITMLHSDSLVITINPASKIIGLAKYISGESEPADITGLDTLLNKIDSINFLGNINQQKKYSLYKSSNAIQQAELYFSLENAMLQKLVYYYNEEIVGSAHRVEIEYKDIDLKASYPKGYFSTDQFIRTDGKNFIAAEAYKEYEVYFKFSDND